MQTTEISDLILGRVFHRAPPINTVANRFLAVLMLTFQKEMVHFEPKNEFRDQEDADTTKC